MFEIFAEYPTFLTFLAFVLAAAITLVIMPLFIKFLRRVHIGQQVRADGPQSHLVKQGTPTMGGVVMLVTHQEVPVDPKHLFVIEPERWAPKRRSAVERAMADAAAAEAESAARD